MSAIADDGEAVDQSRTHLSVVTDDENTFEASNTSAHSDPKPHAGADSVRGYDVQPDDSIKSATAAATMMPHADDDDRPGAQRVPAYSSSTIER